MPGALDRFRLDGQTALVTGGSKGLGLAIAGALASAGARVVLTSRHCAEVEAAAEQLRASGYVALGIESDVARRDSVQIAVRTACEAFGKIDILINNAGINIRGPALDIAESDWDQVLDVNLKGCLLCSQAVAPGMIERGYGRIVMMGSILSSISIPGRAPYASSKHGVLGLVRTLALEWAQTGITVNAICPGPFATEMNRQLLNDPEQYRQFVSRIPMGRWGELEELEGAALFLASAASSFVTGTAIYVDGGWTAQ